MIQSRLVLSILDKMQAQDINHINVRKVADFTDEMIFATGNSVRHVKAITSNIIKTLRNYQIKPLGIEGESNAEWILIDLGDLILHVMLEETRNFYNIEQLWPK